MFVGWRKKAASPMATMGSRVYVESWESTPKIKRSEWRISRNGPLDKRQICYKNSQVNKKILKTQSQCRFKSLSTEKANVLIKRPHGPPSSYVECSKMCIDYISKFHWVHFKTPSNEWRRKIYTKEYHWFIMTRFFKQNVKEIPYVDQTLTNAESGLKNYFIYFL